MGNKTTPLLPPRQELAVETPDPKIGLTQEQVRQRVAAGWTNLASSGILRSNRDIILQNCLTFFNFVFVVLAAFLALCGSSIKNMAFMMVVIINTIIGCVQEIRAKRAVEKLTLVAAQTLNVVREGQTVALHSDELVRDDIVIFGAGDQICADGIVETGELQVNEALITGESDPILKKAGDEVRSGSFVVAGRGHIRLTHVGDDAFAAKLALEAKADPRAAKSEMMRALDKLIRVVGIVLVPVGVLLFCQELFTLNQGLTGSAEATVAALVGMIPEGLYLLTSIAMAASALKLTREHVLVQDMNCIETLARVDVLCVDKTGTITESAMEVENILPLTEDAPEYLEAILNALFGTEEPENDTAKAIAQMFPGQSSWECIHRIPFTSETKWSGGVFREHGAFLAGAPEFIMGHRFGQLQAQTDPWNAAGYRVLLVAAYDGEPAPGALDPERVYPLALILLTNRIRPEAPDTFRYFAEQGVTIKIISGDHPATVSEVARRAGIPQAEVCIDTETLETDEDFRDAAERFTVFGRVTPDKKRQLIRALKAQGHTVAMTGDGVNDVLAMREADCGIAMASGAQAACQVAQLVLVNSDFAAMPGIVGEGRRVINNIQRAATLFLVKNIFSLILAIITLFTNLPYPVIPLHLTVISSLTIGIPSFFLAMEPNYERIQGHFLKTVLRKAFPGGLTNILMILTAQTFMTVFAMAQAQISTICATILGEVGLLVLYQVCKPFDRFRKLIWCAMAILFVICFTFFGGFFELQALTGSSLLVLGCLLVMTPSIFFAVRYLFDLGEKIHNRFRT